MENHFAENLPILRRRAGYTQETLAEALGVSRQAVGKWENGQTMPEATTLLTLAGLLGCSLDALMREELTEEATPEPLPDAEQPEPLHEEEEAELWYIYAQHIDRFSLMIALGVALVPTGVSLMLALAGLLGESGLIVVPLLLCVAAAVFLFINAGLAEEDFKKMFPACPPCPDPEEYEIFHQRFRLLIPAAVAGILLDVAVMIGGATLFARDDTMLSLVMAAFLGVLAICVWGLVYGGIQSNKFPKEK